MNIHPIRVVDVKMGIFMIMAGHINNESVALPFLIQCNISSSTGAFEQTHLHVNP